MKVCYPQSELVVDTEVCSQSKMCGCVVLNADDKDENLCIINPSTSTVSKLQRVHQWDSFLHDVIFDDPLHSFHDQRGDSHKS